ncbi:nuclease, partial [Pseudomonas syringae]
KQIAGWLARNEQKLLAHPELRMNDPVPLRKQESPLIDEPHREPIRNPKPENPIESTPVPKRKFWSKPPIEFKGNRVFQRNDLFDPELMTTWRERGRLVRGTNLERMASGRAPIGIDGESINLHHMIQTQNGAIAELTQTFHQKYGSVIHINPNTIPSGIDRPLFNQWKNDYWRYRAETYEAP